MNKIERVMAAIRHQIPDRVPKGELHIQPELANRILMKEYPLDYQHFERDVAIRQALNMDLVNVGEWPEWEEGISANGNKLVRSIYGQVFEMTEKTKHIYKEAIPIEEADAYVMPDSTMITGSLVKKYVQETDFFVFAQIGGPISMLDEMYSMEDYMVYCLTNTEEIYTITKKVIDYEIEKAIRFLENGAHAILVADDIAFQSGLFLPPYIMQKIGYPFYKKIVSKIKEHRDVPVFLHTDGNIWAALDEITACGFDGIQSIQPSAGMSISKVKEKYGKELCLWGNIDLDEVLCFGTPQEVKEIVKRTIETANVGGGYILSTCNTMIESIPVENIRAMMEAGEEA